MRVVGWVAGFRLIFFVRCMWVVGFPRMLRRRVVTGERWQYHDPRFVHSFPSTPGLCAQIHRIRPPVSPNLSRVLPAHHWCGVLEDEEVECSSIGKNAQPQAGVIAKCLNSSIHLILFFSNASPFHFRVCHRSLGPI